MWIAIIVFNPKSQVGGIIGPLILWEDCVCTLQRWSPVHLGEHTRDFQEPGLDYISLDALPETKRNWFQKN